jgi:hypothetical protein
MGDFAVVGFQARLSGPVVRETLRHLVDEFSAEFATDPPCQPTLPWARREYDGEFSGNFDIFGDDLRAAVGQVRDRAVARQRAVSDLDFRETSAWAPFASASIC